MSASWWTEGTAHRTPVQPNPVVHVLVHLSDGWVMWCSGSKGREDYIPHATRFCRECSRLVAEAIAEETADADEFRRWVK